MRAIALFDNEEVGSDSAQVCPHTSGARSWAPPAARPTARAQAPSTAMWGAAPRHPAPCLTAGPGTRGAQQPGCRDGTAAYFSPPVLRTSCSPHPTPPHPSHHPTSVPACAAGSGQPGDAGLHHAGHPAAGGRRRGSGAARHAGVLPHLCWWAPTLADIPQTQRTGRTPCRDNKLWPTDGRPEGRSPSPPTPLHPPTPPHPTPNPHTTPIPRDAPHPAQTWRMPCIPTMPTSTTPTWRPSWAGGWACSIPVLAHKGKRAGGAAPWLRCRHVYPASACARALVLAAIPWGTHHSLPAPGPPTPAADWC